MATKTVWLGIGYSSASEYHANCRAEDEDYMSHEFDYCEETGIGRWALTAVGMYQPFTNRFADLEVFENWLYENGYDEIIFAVEPCKVTQ